MHTFLNRRTYALVYLVYTLAHTHTLGALMMRVPSATRKEETMMKRNKRRRRIHTYKTSQVRTGGQLQQPPKVAYFQRARETAPEEQATRERQTSCKTEGEEDDDEKEKKELSERRADVLSCSSLIIASVGSRAVKKHKRNAV